MSSFGRSTRRTAARPARTRGVFEKLLSGLAEGVVAVRACVEDMKLKLDESTSRMNYFRDLEKQIKVLERKVRTLEVHRDRIEEMRDEYILKLKLREGAFNIAQALANQTSKAAKEKLQEARAEQRDLLEDLCDIEDELETKLGVFKVHVSELLGLGRGGGGSDIIEAQFKLGSQKWKSKCKVNRHEQIWQDEDIIFLGKIMDELFVKVVEVKKIQGNVLLGNMKCQTREFFSFYPMTVTYDFPTSNAKLSMEVTWSPTIGEDFLSDLNLKTVQCIVGGAQKSPNHMMGVGNVERLRLHPLDPLLSTDPLMRQIRIITEPEGEDLDTHSSNSYGRSEVKTQSISKPKKAKKKKKKKEDSDFVFMDRQSIIETQNTQFPDVLQAPEGRHGNVEGRNVEGRQRHVEGIKVMELCSSPKQHRPVPHPLQQSSRDSSLGSNNSSGSGQSIGSRQHMYRQCTPEAMSLLGMLEAVVAALDEPKELYTELNTLNTQLERLEAALKGGQLIRAPSMTLSESQAMDTFEFLGSEDNILAHRFSRTSIDITESLCHRQRSNSAQLASRHHPSSSGSNTTPTPTSGSQVEVGVEDLHRGLVGSPGSGGTNGGEVNRDTRGTSGSQSVDRALIQHLIHCESLLVHLQSCGPLKYKLSTSLRKLQREAEVISELLNFAAEPTDTPQVDQIFPELAAEDQLMRFWQALAKDDVLSVNYEQFAVKLDEKFGQSLWSEFPEIANKVLTVLMSRVLDLEIEEWQLDDGQMVVTIFQYSSYFLSQGSKGIAKCLSEVARELKVTEGLETNEVEVKKRIASLLPNYGYNRGALLATAHLLGDSDSALHDAALSYVGNFVASSPWHTKAVQCLIELLEHSDQTVRIGACNALASLKATSAASQLKYLSHRDFSPVRAAASRALQAIGPVDELEFSGDSNGKATQFANSLQTPGGKKKHSNLQRTRSAELQY